MKGLKLQSETSFFQIFLHSIVCMGIGAILAFFILTHFTTSASLQLVKEQEKQVDKLVETNEYLRTWKQLVDDRFVEQEAKIKRLTHLMRVPLSERNDAAERYDAFREGEQ